MGAPLSNWSSGLEWRKSEIEEALDKYGEVEVSFRLLTIEDDKTITLAGKRVLVYIREQHERYYPNYKFHLANCSTLIDFQNNGRFEKYVASIRTDGFFKINIIGNNNFVKSDQIEKLKVCKNCLTTLNYIGYNHSPRMKNKIYNSFDLDEFFRSYNFQNIKKPNHTDVTAQLNIYPKDWSDISIRYRLKKGFCCEQCGVNLKNDRKFLHVHHIDGHKANNFDENLKALCVKCHASQPGHGHMSVSDDYKTFLATFENTRTRRNAWNW